VNLIPCPTQIFIEIPRAHQFDFFVTIYLFIHFFFFVLPTKWTKFLQIIFFFALFDHCCAGSDPRSLLLDDGVDVGSPICLPRESLVNAIINTVRDKSSHVFIKAPPASGKTSLLNLVTNALNVLGWSCTYVLMLANTTVKDHLRTQGYLNGIGSLVRGSVLVVDQAEHSFNDSNFWAAFKTGELDMSDILVIAAASYRFKPLSAEAPVRHASFNFNHGLRLSSNEQLELYEKICQNVFAKIGLNSSDDLRAAILEQSGGSAGIIVQLCKAICLMQKAGLQVSSRL
jgi:hypothetical protein